MQTHCSYVILCRRIWSADRFKNEKTIYASEEEERRAKRYDSYMKMAKYMSKEELREAYVEVMIELEEVHRKEKHGNKG